MQAVASRIMAVGVGYHSAVKGHGTSMQINPAGSQLGAPGSLEKLLLDQHCCEVRLY